MKANPISVPSTLYKADSHKAAFFMFNSTIEWFSLTLGTKKMHPKGEKDLYALLDAMSIPYTLYRHPPAPTIEIAREYWKNIPTTHCKNIFCRNHKGNRHYLVVIEHTRELDIHSLEVRLRQGKLTFASPQRLMKYLGVEPGSVTPFGLINDIEHHVHVFLDIYLQHSKTISFHPLTNTASVALRFEDFMKFLHFTGNSYEFIQMHKENI